MIWYLKSIYASQVSGELNEIPGQKNDIVDKN